MEPLTQPAQVVAGETAQAKRTARLKRAATLGQRIQAARDKAGLTRQELADICKVSRQSIYRIETGQTIPGERLTEHLISTLGAEVFAR